MRRNISTRAEALPSSHQKKQNQQRRTRIITHTPNFHIMRPRAHITGNVHSLHFFYRSILFYVSPLLAVHRIRPTPFLSLPRIPLSPQLNTGGTRRPEDRFCSATLGTYDVPKKFPKKATHVGASPRLSQENDKQRILFISARSPPFFSFAVCRSYQARFHLEMNRTGRRYEPTQSRQRAT